MIYSSSLEAYSGFPGGSDLKKIPYNTGDSGSIPELERSPGGRHDNHLGILTWKILWAELSIESQRVRQN